jgi:hypothetical protein
MVRLGLRHFLASMPERMAGASLCARLAVVVVSERMPLEPLGQSPTATEQ